MSRRCQISCTEGRTPGRSASAGPSTSTFSRPSRERHYPRPGSTSRPGSWPRSPGREHEQASAGWSTAEAAASDPRRIYYHPCKTVSNRASLDGAVSIFHAVERFLGDLALDGMAVQHPAGAQRQEARADHRRRSEAGFPRSFPPGAARPSSQDPRCQQQPRQMIRYRITAYRLPRRTQVLDGRARQARGTRVHQTCEHQVKDLAAEKQARASLDTVFVAVEYSYLQAGRHSGSPTPRGVVDAVARPCGGVASGERP